MYKAVNEFIQSKTDEAKSRIVNAGRKVSDSEALEIIMDLIEDSSQCFDLGELNRIIEIVYARTRNKLGLLGKLIESQEYNEIMVNGVNGIFAECSDGKIVHMDGVFSCVEELETIIRNIASGVNREINEMSPILDARLPDGSRVNAVYNNVAVNGPVLTIRKFRKHGFSLKEMIANDTVTEECADFLSNLVRNGYNIFVSGGTSSGKTTFLNILSQFIPNVERVIVIEDSTELQLTHIDNLVQMECHNANSMGQGQITMAELIKASLRMRPDRIIVGEVRGEEVSDMLQALNTGHCGMSTGHANSVKGMLRRMEALYISGTPIPIDAVRAQIVEGIDIMVHLGRLLNGQRKVLEIQELLGYSNGNYDLNPLFILDDDLNLKRTANELQNKSKFRLRAT
ncbi:MAG: ATPase, T2SS/T4P/T4SS family [Eubacteriaceae bacterium]|nr:ATPase, T2SS/T4P/T4SS family [Eubacteriaceae bacterium]